MAVSAPPAQRRGMTKTEKRNQFMGLLFISPWLVGFLLFALFFLVFPHQLAQLLAGEFLAGSQFFFDFGIFVIALPRSCLFQLSRQAPSLALLPSNLILLLHPPW